MLFVKHWQDLENANINVELIKTDINFPQL